MVPTFIVWKPPDSRYAKVVCKQPMSGVKHTLIIPTEVQCEYASIDQRAFYADIEQAIRVVEIYPERFEAATGYRPGVSYGVPVTAYEGVAALGGQLSFPRHHQPMILNQGKILRNTWQVDALGVPDPWNNKRFLRHVNLYEELGARFGESVNGGLAGQEGPVTTAGLLRGEDFFIDCITDARRAHHLLNVCTEMYISWGKASAEVTGQNSPCVGIADDYAGMLAPAMWPKFVLPYYEQIFQKLGAEQRFLHTELVRREHLPLLRELNLDGVNFAENDYIDIVDVQKELPGVFFGWHIKTVSEMLQGSPELIRRRYREIAAAGVQKVYCELAVRTPHRNIKAFLATAEELV